ncbi:glycosyltransferase [Candidatus Pacearchaeota archaeon]|nr:glycosyltransferase [Candidatus Pacearchaeota archaeon]
MNKIRTLFKSPLLTNSGYGSHSRQILKALLSDPIFDVHVDPLQWGICSWETQESELKDTIKKLIEKRMFAKQQNQENWDLFLHCTIPNEFEKLGKVNIGITAGVETDRISHVWVQKCNEMDLVIVPSEHSRKSIVDSVIEWKNEQTGEAGTFKVTAPVSVCHEGFDGNVFKKLNENELSEKVKNMHFESEFNFLTVGQWGNGGFGEDRKNISNLVKYFIEAFLCRKDVGLILKISMAKNSLIDEFHVKRRLSEITARYDKEDLPPIWLLHGYLTEQEMASLYNHPQVKSYITLSNGEGFGIPELESAACELPVIATNWSGHLDFLKKGLFSAVDYELKDIPDAAVWDPILIKGSRWAAVKEDDAKHRMKKMVSSYFKPTEWAKELGKEVRSRFELQFVNQEFLNVIKQCLLKQMVKLSPREDLASYIDTPNDYNVFYSMPMSAGDVYISTAVINGLRKKLPENAKIYFATQEKYKDILKNNPDVYKVIPWNDNLLNVDLLESVFDLALTPNVATHYIFSNWVRKGQYNRLLAEEYANFCRCELGDYFIDKEKIDIELPENYMTFHNTSGKGQWEGRRYEDWQEVLDNLKSLYPELKIVQVGLSDEPEFKNIDVDLRGKLNYQQLAGVIEKSLLHLSPDTFSMHISCSLSVPTVAIFGCSVPQCTGPWVKDKSKAKYILLQSERKTGCFSRPCYKNRCANNPEGNSTINEIPAEEIFKACEKLLKEYEVLNND